MLVRFSCFLIWFLFSAIFQDSPPNEEGSFLAADLVELSNTNKGFKLDIRYASKNNFTGKAIYAEGRAFLQRPAAEALVRVQKKANEFGFGLLIYDAYRPWSVTKVFWNDFPEFRPYLSNPAKGSRHNRGCAVDLSFFDLKSGEPIDMPSGYDEFTERAHPDYSGGSVESRRHRDLLRNLMESEGFSVYENEWWHFDYKNWKEYKVLNIEFSKIDMR